MRLLGSDIGTEAVVRAIPDDCTLLLAVTATIAQTLVVLLRFFTGTGVAGLMTRSIARSCFLDLAPAAAGSAAS